jgi:hypothetical protein
MNRQTVGIVLFNPEVTFEHEIPISGIQRPAE